MLTHRKQCVKEGQGQGGGGGGSCPGRLGFCWRGVDDNLAGNFVSSHFPFLKAPVT